MRSLALVAVAATFTAVAAAQGRATPPLPPIQSIGVWTPAQERWTGLRLGPDGTAARLSGIARVLPTDSLDRMLSAALVRASGPLYAPLDVTTRDELRLKDLVFAGRDVRNLRPLVDSLRLVKDADEITRMRKTVGIPAAGPVAAMQAARPGAWGDETAAALEAPFRRQRAG